MHCQHTRKGPDFSRTVNAARYARFRSAEGLSEVRRTKRLNCVFRCADVVHLPYELAVSLLPLVFNTAKSQVH